MTDRVSARGRNRIVALASLLLGSLLPGQVDATTVATPVITPAVGTSYVQTSVTVSDATSGSTIYYTLDGTTPTTSSSSVASAGTVLISKSQTLKAYAVESGYTDSAVATATYQITGQVAGGYYHTIALKTDGSVWTWGYNAKGQVGDGTTTTRYSAVHLTTLSGIVEVGAGVYHSLALKNDGTVWSWGLNSSGQLGINATYQCNSPVQVKKSNGSGGTTPLTNIVAIYAGGYHNFALDSSGTVWGWGLNSSGQLGDGTTTQRNMAVQITMPSGVTVQALAAGSYHSMLLTTTGAVWSWGLNSNGELGDGTTTSRNSPVAVTALNGVSLVALSGGSMHSMALQSDGSVWTWGYNSSGQLGNGTTTQSNSPVHLTTLTGFTSIQAGIIHSAAIKSDGSVWTWGSNACGELGNGSIIASSTPVQATGVSGALLLAAGNEYTLALKNDGTLWGCGYASDAETGGGISSAVTKPTPLVGLNNISAISGSNIGYHSLFIGAGGAVYAIGENSYGELGDGTTNVHLGADSVSMTNLTAASAVGVGRNHSLAVRASDGTVWAWGLNSNGQLGNNSTTNSSSPVQVSSLTGVKAVAGGGAFSLALKNDGTVWAWGANTDGNLGIGNYAQHTTPVQVSVASGTALNNIIQVGCGYDFSAALKNDGTVWVWGVNTYGQMGNNSSQVLRPIEMTDANDPSGFLTGVASIVVGSECILALKTDGTLWGWGANDQGQLSNSVGYSTSVVHQILVPGTVIQIAEGTTSTFAETSDGNFWSFGQNNWGQLGDGTQSSRSTIAQFTGLSGITALSAGSGQGLALRENGTVLVWGSQNIGQCGFTSNYLAMTQALGFNAIANVPTPTLSITSPVNNATIALGSSFTFSASASEAGGTIASVGYYLNGALLGTSTVGSSFNVTWNPPTWGNLSFTAVATDTSGNTSYRSSPVTIQVPYDSDSNSLPDWWELKYFPTLGNNAGSSPDGNGYTLLQDYQNGSDPTNYFSQNGQIITPVLTIVSGNNQIASAGGFTDQPLTVSVTNSNGGALLPNAPVTFGVVSGGGLLSSTRGGTTSSGNLSVRGDGSGLARAFYQSPALNNATSTISAAVVSQSVAFNETTSPGDGTFDAPTNMAATSISNTEIDLSWTNNASSATGIEIQQSTDGLNWTTTVELSDPTTTTYAATGLSAGQNYQFRVGPTK